MISKLLLGTTLAMGLATSAYAGIAVAPVAQSGLAITKVAEGCGPGFWRGPGGHCHPFAHGRLCPPDYHIGPEGMRCWPN